MGKKPKGRIVKKMCNGCVRAFRGKCLIQKDPSWVYRKYNGKCWSRLESLEEAKAIEEAVKEYCMKHGEGYRPLWWTDLCEEEDEEEDEDAGAQAGA